MTEKIDDNPVFPKSLSQKDKELVIRQCELQHANSKEQIEGMAKAYDQAKRLAEQPELLSNLTGEQWESLILDWATYIESRNTKGYRRVPVQFANLSQAIPPGSIPRAMSMFVVAYAENELTPEELYEEFENIHPFEDGNGRVGDLLWKIATTRNTQSWPEQLPPDLFGVHKNDISENKKQEIFPEPEPIEIQQPERQAQKEPSFEEIQKFFNNPQWLIPDNNRDITSARNIAWIIRNFHINNGPIPKPILRQLIKIRRSRQT